MYESRRVGVAGGGTMKHYAPAQRGGIGTHPGGGKYAPRNAPSGGGGGIGGGDLSTPGLPHLMKSVKPETFSIYSNRGL
eukprot:CAMPEP_0181387130 /NCGR_PEP_ID=MMETSP1106-20121128/23541_1 /TAXON_ID=81844 /ORGANISM="Mantoniella antarctica, Strain SL-175" /LENGTH=78 /DNA_ID=CAMNT_0023507461 /DNA_START=241 /DNA_END=473 /DNA_ORIENTATION=-